MPLAALIIYCILVLTSLITNIIHLDAGTGIIKALPTLVLVVCALAYSHPRFGLWITVAIALGAVGDYSLASAERAWFLTGLSAFFIGHVAYSIAFAKDLRWTKTRGIVIAATLSGMAALLATVSINIFRVGESGLIAPLIGYVIVMGVMTVFALLHQSPTKFIAAGAVIFVISDAHIAVNHMLLSTPLLAITMSGYVTYYLAQYLLVAGAVFETHQKK